MNQDEKPVNQDEKPIELKPVQYATLVALSQGKPCTLWPTMRIMFVSKGWIKATGPTLVPRKKRLAKQPRRLYVVTAAGLEMIAGYKGVIPRSRPSFPYLLFGKSE